MIKKFIFSAIAGVFIINVSPVQATVGGPTVISEVRANEAGEVIYVQQSMSGRGCPPIIYSLDTETGAKNVLVSCDLSEQDLKGYTELFSQTLVQFPTVLESVAFESMGVEMRAKINVVREVTEDLENNVFSRTDYSVDILRNDQKLGTLEYSGCKPDQAHEFKIYPLANPDKLLIKSTSIGDCFEGGYPVDRLHLLDNPISPSVAVTTTQTGGGLGIPSYVYQIIIVLILGGMAWFVYGRKDRITQS